MVVELVVVVVVVVVGRGCSIKFGPLLNAIVPTNSVFVIGKRER